MEDEITSTKEISELIKELGEFLIFISEKEIMLNDITDKLNALMIIIEECMEFYKREAGKQEPPNEWKNIRIGK